jgi:lipoyl(octanoyl) transferase
MPSLAHPLTTELLEWRTSATLEAYESAIAFMEQRAADIHDGRENEMVWLLEHPPLYTAGTSARSEDLLDKERFPLYQTGRGGQFTYHGPGQRIAYVMLDLKKRAAPAAPDIRRYVQQLEQWLIDSLSVFGVTAFIREGRVGVWTFDQSGKECKIAAIGIRVRKWVSYHGISLNVTPDLSHYAGIVPCGIQEYGVTSLNALGIKASMQDVDAVLKEQFAKQFGCN